MLEALRTGEALVAGRAAGRRRRAPPPDRRAARAGRRRAPPARPTCCGCGPRAWTAPSWPHRLERQGVLVAQGGPLGGPGRRARHVRDQLAGDRLLKALTGRDRRERRPPRRVDRSPCSSPASSPSASSCSCSPSWRRGLSKPQSGVNRASAPAATSPARPPRPLSPLTPPTPPHPNPPLPLQRAGRLLEDLAPGARLLASRRRSGA